MKILLLTITLMLLEFLFILRDINHHHILVYILFSLVWHLVNCLPIGWLLILFYQFVTFLYGKVKFQLLGHYLDCWGYRLVYTYTLNQRVKLSCMQLVKVVGIT